MVLASLNDQKYPRYKFNVTLARLLRLVILYFLNGNSCQMISTCIFMTENGTLRSDMDGLTHYTKQLLNIVKTPKMLAILSES